jgi:hypothetical protein
MLKSMLNKVRKLLTRASDVMNKARDVRYVSVPVWRPWRDF